VGVNYAKQSMRQHSPVAQLHVAKCIERQHQSRTADKAAQYENDSFAFREDVFLSEDDEGNRWQQDSKEPEWNEVSWRVAMKLESHNNSPKQAQFERRDNN